jgi:hypothetical protein
MLQAVLRKYLIVNEIKSKEQKLFLSLGIRQNKTGFGPVS